MILRMHQVIKHYNQIDKKMAPLTSLPKRVICDDDLRIYKTEYIWNSTTG